MLAVIALLFVVLPIVEITVAVQVAHHIGVLNTVGLLLLFSIAGYWLARLEGFSVIRRIQDQLEHRAVPTNELIEGALVFAGGMLLVVPGFVTDALGLRCSSRSPGTRRRRLLKRRFGMRVRRHRPRRKRRRHHRRLRPAPRDGRSVVVEGAEQLGDDGTVAASGGFRRSLHATRSGDAVDARDRELLDGRVVVG